jgi:hypothetical protein
MTEVLQDILDSYINGQFQQMKRQFLNLNQTGKLQFIEEIKDFDLGLDDATQISILSMLVKFVTDK